jgi:signal transduction histidine kinase
VIERLDLTELVAQTVDRIDLTTSKHQVRLTRADPVVLRGDRDRLESVILTLLDNAIRYMPRGGPIDVEVTVLEKEAVVSVRDEGVGIPKAKQAHIFERFYRAHTGTPYDYGGMGVALYIARKIVAQHGGRTWFESEENKGSTFSFSLPLEQPASGQKASPE